MQTSRSVVSPLVHLTPTPQLFLLGHRSFHVSLWKAGCVANKELSKTSQGYILHNKDMGRE